MRDVNDVAIMNVIILSQHCSNDTSNFITVNWCLLLQIMVEEINKVAIYGKPTV